MILRNGVAAINNSWVWTSTFDFNLFGEKGQLQCQRKQLVESLAIHLERVMAVVAYAATMKHPPSCV